MLEWIDSENGKDRRLVSLLIVVAVAISCGLNYSAYQMYGLETEWLLALVIVTMVAAAAIDFIVSYWGYVRPFYGRAMVSLVAAQGLVGCYAIDSDVGLDSVGFLLFFIVSVAFSSFGFVIQTSVFPFSSILRITANLKCSGNFSSASIVLRVSENDLRIYGNGFLEDRIKDVLRSGYTSRVKITPGNRTVSGYSVLRAIDEKVMFRLKDGLLEAVILPLDGRYYRFERAANDALELRFHLKTQLLLKEPSDEELNSGVENLKHGFEAEEASRFNVIRAMSKARTVISGGKSTFSEKAKRYLLSKVRAISSIKIGTVLMLGILLFGSIIIFADNERVNQLFDGRVARWGLFVSVIAGIWFIFEKSRERKK